MKSKSLSSIAIPWPKRCSIGKNSFDVYDLVSMKVKIFIVAPCELRSEFRLRKNYYFVADQDLSGYASVQNSLLSSKEQGFISRSSWYLQQYLKLQFAKEHNSPIFIQDADTIFNPRFLVDLIESPFLLKTKERVEIYNNFISLLPVESFSSSFIANGGYFDGSYLHGGFEPVVLLNFFLESLKDEKICEFSEYQVMGSIINSEGKLTSRFIKLFRRYDLIQKSESWHIDSWRYKRALRVYDAIAFEETHRTSIVKNFAIILRFLLKHSW